MFTFPFFWALLTSRPFWLKSFLPLLWKCFLYFVRIIEKAVTLTWNLTNSDQKWTMQWFLCFLSCCQSSHKIAAPLFSLCRIVGQYYHLTAFKNLVIYVWTLEFLGIFPAKLVIFPAAHSQNTELAYSIVLYYYNNTYDPLHSHIFICNWSHW